MPQLYRLDYMLSGILVFEPTRAFCTVGSYALLTVRLSVCPSVWTWPKIRLDFNSYLDHHVWTWDAKNSQIRPSSKQWQVGSHQRQVAFFRIKLKWMGCLSIFFIQAFPWGGEVLIYTTSKPVWKHDSFCSLYQIRMQFQLCSISFDLLRF